MTRPAESRYPSRLSYVLKLRGDARLQALAGRLENLVTGQRVEFTSSDELLDAIGQDLDVGAAEQPGE